MLKINKIIKLLLSLFFVILFYNFSISYADDIEIEENLNFSQELQNTLINEVSAHPEKPLNLNSRSCIVLDRTSKTVLFGKNERNKVKMASTTKIMTAIVIIENCDLNTTVEISKKAAGTGGSRLGLKTNDKITVHDLLYGLLLCSGNDAAVALAEFAGSNISEFCEMMNKKAQELNLENTHFESPHGLDSDGHYTTAFELALLTDYALNNPIFSQIVGTKNYTITINGYPKNLNNTNELLGYLERCIWRKNGIY